MAEQTPKNTRHAGAVIYTRVSTGDQDKNGTSPETQLDACRVKAQALGLPIIAEYHDGGISGGLLTTRTGMQSALSDIRAGRADTIICANISRYSRDVEHQQQIKKAVRAAGGRVAFCDMDFDDTPEGDLAFNVLGGFAEYERKMIRSRTMRGKRRRAEEGRQMAPSRSPLGYHVVQKEDILRGQFPAEMLGRYVIDEERAPVVREMFARYASGQDALSGLCRDLNGRKAPTPRGGAFWWPSTIYMILANPVYKGEPAYGRTVTHTDEERMQEGHRVTGRPLLSPRFRMPAEGGKVIPLSAPPLVSEELWDEAQRRLILNRTYQGGNPKRARMLSGRVFCPCGHAAVLQNAHKGSPAYYRCGVNFQARRNRGEEVCDSINYRTDAAERAVMLAFLSAAREPDALADARRLYAERDRKAMGDTGDDARRELAALDRALSELSQEEAAAVQGQIVGIRAGASPGAYAEVFAQIAARRKDMEERRGRLSRALNSAPMSARRKTAQEADAALRALEDAALVLSAEDVPGETKRDILGMVVERVICQPGGAEIHFLPGFGHQDTIQTVKTVWIGNDITVNQEHSE